MTTSTLQKAARITAVGGAATAGVLTTLLFNPHAMTLVTEQTSLVQSSSSAQSATVSSASGSTATAASPDSSTSGSQTYRGGTVQTRYGPVQVEITVDGNGSITDVTWLQYPDGEGKSVQINQRAMPLLTDETLQSQSASVSTIAGASYTTQGFEQSLQSALDQAGI